MAIKRYTVGPGTLTVGTAGTAIDLTAQLTNGRIEWSESENATESIPVLSGEETGEESTATYSAVFAGNLVQDIATAGVVAWSWTNKGAELPFTFVPSTAAGRRVTGTVRVAPINLGGDVNDKTPRSDFSWRCVNGDPVLGDVPA